ncbi:hypothetical protein DFP94_10289 [Fontibacillus phaseoli]|uniref:Uncharacterized protein n=1 Tax=Fontibacillus phaseoli TaxID=1416533 RepID=A0A369BID4_9BACL|nr:hypothetical protein [Fontibacillus phaseoli]RCX21342.1 hypothetical protein DFP94_10289 [Fontibacillus phaseoli]
MEQQLEPSEQQLEPRQDDMQRDDELILTVDDILKFYAGRH